MELLPMLGLALVALLFGGLLRQYHAGYALLLSLAACTILLLAAVRAMEPVLSFAERLSAYAAWGDFGCLLKAVAITLLSQGMQELCREAGQTALAGRVELAGKVAVLLAALPLFVSLAEMILELLQ